MDNNARIDFAALDSTLDAERFDKTVRAITAETMTLRARSRRNARSVFSPFVAWSRPTLVAAAAVLILAGAGLILLPARAVAAPASLAESAGIPASLVELATTGRPATASELVDAFDAMQMTVKGR